MFLRLTSTICLFSIIYRNGGNCLPFKRPHT